MITRSKGLIVALFAFVLLAAPALADPMPHLRVLAADITTNTIGPRLRALEGHKTVYIEYTGTATVELRCKVSENQVNYEVKGSLTGADQEDMFEFDSACSTLWVNVAGCSGCNVDAWILNPEGR